MAASNQFQCPIWQQLKSNCSINCMTQLKHQQEWFVFLHHIFQSSDFLGKQWSDFTYLKQVLFLQTHCPYILAESAYFPLATSLIQRQELCLCEETRRFVIQSQRNGQQQGQNGTQFRLIASLHICPANKT